MEADGSIKPLPVPESRGERVLYALIVIALPIICFSLSDVLKPEWQSGKFSDYALLPLNWRAAVFFSPFLLYAVVCMILLLVAPQRFAPHFVVRFGIYTGCVLALQYAILVVGTNYATMSVLSAGFLILVKWLPGKIKSQKILMVFFALLIIAGIGAAVWFHFSFDGSFLVCFGILMASPFLCLAIAVATAIKLIKIYETKTFRLWHATTLAAWSVSYLFAWRFSVLQAIEIYYSLPTSPPNCYIATASARGHRRIIHSRMLMTATGAIWVTTQLQVLKCAELALMALAPRLHALLRRVYDWFGPPLARKLTNPFLADLAYLTLKPFEWAARLILKAIVPEVDEYAGRLYSQK